MIFRETKLKGAFVIEIEEFKDDRGFFARTWCKREFSSHGLKSDLAQCSVSFNHKAGTLRGLHYQADPYQEAKLVRCSAGAIYDVIVDLRRESNTYTGWIATELDARNHRMVYVPEGFAHGFQTLEDDTEVVYQISEFHEPDYAKGIRWNDPALGIQWPTADRIISTRDAAYPDFVR